MRLRTFIAITPEGMEIEIIFNWIGGARPVLGTNMNI